MDTLLCEVTIPSTVEIIWGGGVFHILPDSGLMEFRVADGNDRYWEWEGALYKISFYEADDVGRVTTSCLLKVPVDYTGNLDVAEVQEIEGGAFYRCGKSLSAGSVNCRLILGAS